MIGLVDAEVEYCMNVPLATPIRGREALRSELERQNAISTGILTGNQVHHIASAGEVVFVERSDVFEMGKQIELRINAVFEVRDGAIVAWREYFDSLDLGLQLGVDPAHFYEG